MTVEIFHRDTRVASHARSYVAYSATTNHHHRPKSHQAHLEWTPSVVRHEAGHFYVGKDLKIPARIQMLLARL